MSAPAGSGWICGCALVCSFLVSGCHGGLGWLSWRVLLAATVNWEGRKWKAFGKSGGQAGFGNVCWVDREE